MPEKLEGIPDWVVKDDYALYHGQYHEAEGEECEAWSMIEKWLEWTHCQWAVSMIHSDGSYGTGK